jgi:aminocarboxymuconate-semialdehyde decarboxylase
MNIDMHSHAFPPAYIELLRERGTLGDVQFVASDGKDADVLIVEGGRRRVAMTPRHVDHAVLLADMGSSGIDCSALSPSPTMFHYELNETDAVDCVRAINSGFATMSHESGGRHVVLATVPLQHGDLAIAELGFAVDSCGARGVAIATNINGRNLDDPDFRPFFSDVAERGLPVFIHPANVLGSDRLSRYYLGNLIGNPVETGVAVASLIFGGVLDDFPSLRVILCHGGGVTTSLLGRWDHGFDVRPEPKGHIDRHPTEYLDHFYYDTITHDSISLTGLIEQVGDDHVVLGSDYPFDMGDATPLASLQAVPDLSAESFSKIAGGNAATLLRMGVPNNA